MPYDLTPIDFSKQEQKTPAFLSPNLNGKIPVVDERAEGRAIFERGAILWPLTQKYSRSCPLTPCSSPR